MTSKKKKDGHCGVWYTPKLRDQKQLCKRLERSWRKDFSAVAKAKYREAIKAYKLETRTAQAGYFERISSASNSSREICKIPKSLLKPSEPPLSSIDPLGCCNDLAHFFFFKNIDDIYSSFPPLSGLVDAPLSDSQVQLPDLGIATIPPMDLTSMKIYLEHLKSGSPSDMAPPAVLNQV